MGKVAIRPMNSRIESLTAQSSRHHRVPANINTTEQRFLSKFAKRSIDVSISLVAIFLLLPLFVIVAIAIKLDSSGPVLFCQARRGLNGKPFKILKFRTMTVLENGDVIQQATRGDARVTRLGSWLRRMSIDELPQLVNVLRGDMSLVGPRPHAVAHDDYYGKLIENYNARQAVRPGMTGWAQVNGARGETPELSDMRRRIELDLWYIHRWSVWLDLRIVVLTAFQILRNPDAF